MGEVFHCFLDIFWGEGELRSLKASKVWRKKYTGKVVNVTKNIDSSFLGICVATRKHICYSIIAFFSFIEKLFLFFTYSSTYVYLVLIIFCFCVIGSTFRLQWWLGHGKNCGSYAQTSVGKCYHEKFEQVWQMRSAQKRR